MYNQFTKTLLGTKHINHEFEFATTKKALSIFSASNCNSKMHFCLFLGASMDVCLAQFGHCNYVSSKHACIFYDEVSNHTL